MATATLAARDEIEGAPARRAGDVALGLAVLVGAVLRLWDLGATPLSIDETYTALAGRLGAVDLVRHIDATDPHGPLSYLVLQPIASHTADVGTLRLVSAVASVLALVALAVWQRRAGLAGVVATAVFAVSPFQLMYGREVRMYGLLSLAGVVAAWCGQRWLEDSRTRWALGAAGAGLVAALSHAVGPLLLAALLLLPLLRRDRSAWVFRGVVAGAVTLFGVLWGAHTMSWSGRSGELPTATLRWLSIVVNETVAPAPDDRWLALALLVGGAAAILVARGPRARVWVCLGAVPVVVLYLASLQRGVLVPKSLMPFSWAAALALGALCAAVYERWRPVGVAAMALVALAVVPLSLEALHVDEGADRVTAAALDHAGPDDGFVHLDSRWQLASLLGWYGGVEGARPTERGGPLDTIQGYDVRTPASEPRPARLWFLSMQGDRPPEGLTPCGPVEPLDPVISIQCLEVPTGSTG